MGGLRSAIPFTFMMMLAGTLALTGFPYTAGYFSKDAIIEVAHASHAPGAEYAFWALIIAAFLTSFYSWRLVFMAFFGKPWDKHAFEHAHESPPVMTVPLLVLAIGALGAGVVFAPYFIEDGYAKFWRAALFTLPDNTVLADSHTVESLLMKWLPTLMMLGGFVLAYVSISLCPALPAWTVRNFKPIHAFLLNKWYFDELYDSDLRAAAALHRRAFSGWAATARSSTASAPTASRRAFGAGHARGAAADRLRLPICFCHADRCGRTFSYFAYCSAGRRSL